MESLPASSGNGSRGRGDGAVRLRGRFCSLRAVERDDYEKIFRAETAEPLLVHWRYRGVVPSPERFAKTLWEGVLCQFIVCSPSDDDLGLVTAYRASQRGGYAYIAVASFDPRRRSVAVAEGALLFVEYLFRVFPFRKLYAEVLGFNESRMHEGLSRFLVEEGCLREHEYFDGRWWDLYIFAVWRDTWFRDKTVRSALARTRVQERTAAHGV